MSKKKKDKKFTKEQRIEKGKKWILKYDGEKIIKAYAKKFKINFDSAICELKEIGYKFESGYIQKFKENEKRILKQKKMRRKKRKLEKQLKEDIYIDSNDTFYYIAGHTSGGASYGVTWEKMGLEPYEELL